MSFIKEMVFSSKFPNLDLMLGSNTSDLKDIVYLYCGVFVFIEFALFNLIELNREICILFSLKSRTFYVKKP